MADRIQEDIISLAVEAGGIESELTKVVSTLAKYNASLSKFTAESVQFNQANKTIEIALKGLSAASEQVAKSFSINLETGAAKGIKAVVEAAKGLIDVQKTLSTPTKTDSITNAATNFQRLVTTTQEGFLGLFKLVTDLTKSVDSLNAAEARNIELSKKAAIASAEALKVRQAAVNNQLRQRDLNTIPEGASESSIAKFIAEKAAFAASLKQKVQGSTFTETASASLDAAQKGILDAASATARQEVAALRVVTAYQKMKDSVKNASEEAVLGAQKAEAALSKLINKIIDRAAKEQAAAAKARERANASDIIGQSLRQQFPVPEGVSREDVSRLEIPIVALTEKFRKSALTVKEFEKSFTDLATTGKTEVAGIDASFQRLTRSIFLAAENLAKVGTKDTLAPLEQRIQSAANVMAKFTQQFSQPLQGKGLQTDKIDLLIGRLGVLSRQAGIGEDRIRTFFNATQVAGAVNTFDNLSKSELQVISLLQRIQTEYNKLTGSIKPATDKQAELQAKLQSASLLVNQFVAGLGGIPRVLNAADFARLQNGLNTAATALAKSKLTADQLKAVIESIGSGGGGFKPPTTLFPAGGGGEEQNQLLRLQGLFEEVGKKGEEAGRRILISWSTVFRIFQVQILHQILGQFIQDMRSSVDEAIKLQVKIAEIRTISQDAQLSTGRWAAELVKLSNAFALPILDVAKAAYDAISNQIGQGAKAVQFLETSLNFARVTVSSATDAVNLLSSAVKSFGENNVTAERAASVLFNVIDFGRVTASEMANTFGRVAGIASQAGVSIEELGAAVTTLTIRGVKYNEAYTLINNVLLKLIRPTGEMKKFFDQIGVASGEAAIQTFGFVGVLRLLQQEFEKGGLTRLGELEVNIRAIRGALGLVSGDAFAGFENDLDRITNGVERFRTATELSFEGLGFKFQQQTNEIKNFFSTEFGTSVIKLVLELTEPLGGLANIVKNVAGGFLEFGKIIKDTFLSFQVLKLQGITTLFSEVNLLLGSVGLGLPSLRTFLQLLVSYITVTTSARATTAAFSVILHAWEAGVKASTVALVNWTLSFFPAITAQKAKTANTLLDQFAMTSNTVATTANTTATRTWASTQAASATAVQGAAGVIGLLSLAIGGLTFLYLRNQSVLESFNDGLLRNAEAHRQSRTEAERDRIERERSENITRFNRVNEESFLKINQVIARVRASLTAFLRDSTRSQAVGAETLRAQLNDVEESAEQAGRTVRQAIEENQKLLEASKKIIVDIRARDRTRGFEQSLLGTGQAAQAELVLRFVNQIREEIVRASNIPIIGANSLIPLARFIEETNTLERTLSNTRQIFSGASIALRGFAENGAQLQNSTNDLTERRRLLAQIPLISPSVIEEARRQFDELDRLLTRHIDQLESAVKSQERLIADLRTRFETRAFERSLIGLNPAEQTRRTLGRVEELRTSAIDLFNRGNLEESRRRFEEIDKLLQEIFDKQRKFREEAGRLGVTFSTPLVGGTIDRLLERNERDRLGLEERLRGQLVNAQQTAAQQQRTLTEQRIALETVFQQSQAQHIRAIVSAENEILRINERILEITRERQRLVDANAANETRLSTSRTERSSSVDSLLATLRERFGEINRDAGNFTVVGQAATASARAIEQLITNISAFRNQPENEQLRNTIDTQLSELNRLLTNLSLNRLGRQLSDVNGGVLGLGSNARLNAGQPLDQFLEEQVPQVREQFRALTQQLDQFRTVFNTIISSQTNIREAELQQNRLNEQNAGINTLLTTYRTQLETLSPAVNTQVTATVQVTDSFTRLNTILPEVINSLQRIANIRGGNVPGGARGGLVEFGKIRGFAGGGLASSDTQLAALTPGEFISTAQATRKFLPQLIGMNSGIAPTFNSASSSSNMSFGDINVTIAGGKTSAASAREIVHHIQREMRRNTLRSF